MKIYMLKIYDDDTFKRILLSISDVFKGTNNIIVENPNDAEIIFIFLQNSSREKRENILNVVPDFNIYDLKNNNAFFNAISNYVNNNKDKRFIMYSRMDQSSTPSDIVKYFLVHDNFRLFIKDYATDYLNDEKFLVNCRELMCPEIEKYFGFEKESELTNNSRIPNNFKTLKSCENYLKKKEPIEEKYKDKIFLYNIYPNQYSFWNFGNNGKTLKIFDNKYTSNKKVYNVFFCKHQRNTVDGIARRYLLECELPKLKEKIENTIYFDKLDQNKYWELLSKSKITISPFGMGERIDDDLRAPLYNTIVIKPICDDVYDYTNLFTNKTFNIHHKKQFTQHIVFCKRDFSDLQSVVEDVLNNYEHYLSKVLKYREECYEYIKSNRYQEDFLEVFNKVI